MCRNQACTRNAHEQRDSLPHTLAVAHSVKLDSGRQRRRQLLNVLVEYTNEWCVKRSSLETVGQFDAFSCLPYVEVHHGY